MEKKTSDLSSKLAEFTVGFDLDSVPAKALENEKWLHMLRRAQHERIYSIFSVLLRSSLR